MSDEIKYWTEVQEDRGCFECRFFDDKKKGYGGFCTYGFRLDIEQDQETKTETCHTRRNKD